MIRFSHADQKFEIRWSYIKEENNVPADATRINTRCVIYSDNKFLCSGETIKAINDPHCKDTARKLSLSRALQSIDREHREKFWNAYHNRKKTSPQPTPVEYPGVPA